MPAMRLAIIGAGPKAAAIAAKAACLRDLASLALEVVVFERDEIGAAWCGNHGYTDGMQRLCTPAERDIGFPYDTDLDEKLSDEMQRRFSWIAYAIANNRFGDWVDRGRPKPTHAEFAAYLGWCFGKLDPIRFGTVTGLRHRNNRWSISYTDAETGNAERKGGFDGVVITGPGPQSERLRKPADDRIFDGVGFWRPGVVEQVKVAAGAAPEDPVVIVGSGGTAAATAAALIRAGVTNPIIVLGSQAALYARADSYFENRTFRDPKFWAALSDDDRRVFSDRLTRGAVWSNVVDVLTQVDTVDYLQGSATEVAIDHSIPTDPTLMVRYTNSANPEDVKDLAAGVVIDATGFDPMWFRKLLTPTLQKRAQNERRMRGGLRRDLSLPLKDVPKLHVPMIAQARGPAYNSLMALGSLSDAILAPYVKALA